MHLKERILICGTGSFAHSLAEEVNRAWRHRVTILGLLSEDEAAGVDKPRDGKIQVLGGLNRLQAIIREYEPDRIIVALAEQRNRLPVYQLIEAKVGQNIQVDDGDAVYERLTGKLALETLKPSRVIFSNDFSGSRVHICLARMISLLVSVTGLVITAPLFLLISLAILVDTGGPVFFVQQRVGWKNRVFNLVKFRTMCPTQEKVSEWAGDNTDRITRVGTILRKYRLDELPQFFNVIKGDMNLVGPRPHPASNYELFVLVSRNMPECGDQIPFYSLRSLVPPGITGWAQVKYRYANNLDEEIEKLRFDLYYVKHASLWLDFNILIETLKVIVMGHKVGEEQQEVVTFPYEENLPVNYSSSPALVRDGLKSTPADTPNVAESNI